MEGTGEGCGFFCSPKSPYLSTMSQQFCRRLYVHSIPADSGCAGTKTIPPYKVYMEVYKVHMGLYVRCIYGVYGCV